MVWPKLSYERRGKVSGRSKFVWWPAASLSGGGATLRRRQRKQRGREEEDNRLDLFAISEKFRGPTVKQK